MFGDDLPKGIAHQANLLAQRSRHLMSRGVAHTPVRGLALAWRCHTAETLPSAPVCACGRRPAAHPYTSPGDDQRPAGDSRRGWPRPVWAPLGIDVAGRFHAARLPLRSGPVCRGGAMGLMPASLRETLASDAVFYCVPISAFESTLREHLPLFRGDGWNPHAHRRALREDASARGVRAPFARELPCAAHTSALRAGQRRRDRASGSDDRRRRLPIAARRAGRVEGLLRVEGARGGADACRRA